MIKSDATCGHSVFSSGNLAILSFQFCEAYWGTRACSTCLAHSAHRLRASTDFSPWDTPRVRLAGVMLIANRDSPLNQKGKHDENHRAYSTAFPPLRLREFHAHHPEEASFDQPLALQPQETQSKGRTAWKQQAPISLIRTDFKGGRWTEDRHGGVMDDALVCLDGCGWKRRKMDDSIRRRADLVDLRFARGGYRAVGGTCSACRRSPVLSGCAGELFLRSGKFPVRAHAKPLPAPHHLPSQKRRRPHADLQQILHQREP